MLILLHLIAAQKTTEADFMCKCMEYWKCFTSGGSARTYCPLSSPMNVCCFISDEAKPQKLLSFELSTKPSHCGKKGFDTEKDGEAEMSEWPWHAAILEKPEDLYVCGASLMSDTWILTAAHCIDDYMTFNNRLDSILKVRLGEYDVSATSELLSHVEIDVEAIELHPDFNNATLFNDIAMLKLAAPIKRMRNIDTVCMPKRTDAAHVLTSRCYVTGWGRRSETSEHSVVLKEIKVPLWNQQSCQTALREQFGPAYILPNTAICAGAEGRDACDGDGGGPLVCEKDGRWYQIGVVSFGIGCGRRNTPGVYTRVAAFESWISDTIKRYEA